MLSLFVMIVLWVIIWAVAWVFFFYVIEESVAPLHFFLLSLIPLYFFKELYGEVIREFTLLPIIVLVLALGIGVLITRIYYPKEKNLFLFIFSHVFFQQVLVVLLVFTFLNAGVSDINTLLYTAIIFFSVHIPGLITMGRKGGLLFLVAAIPAAIVFPLLIIKIHYGFALSFTLHVLFYAGLTVIVRKGSLRFLGLSKQS